MPVYTVHENSYYTAKQAGFMPTSWCTDQNCIDRKSGFVGSLEDSV